MVRSIKKVIKQKGTGKNVVQISGSATALKGKKAQRLTVKETLKRIKSNPMRETAAIRFRQILKEEHPDWSRSKLNAELAKRMRPPSGRGLTGR